MKELDDIGLINAISREPIKESEVYTFTLRLCDNDIDRDFERFDDSTLEELAPMFVGKAGIFDHQWLAKRQAAHIYRTKVVSDDGALTSDGRPRRFLKGWAYMMRTPENAAIIAEIDGGIKREVSVGCAVEQVLCSICGRPINECQHKKGTEYDGKMCCGLLVGATDAYEWAFVTNPTPKDGFMQDIKVNYRELIGRLRASNRDALVSSEEAATAIESLLTERDAAIDRLSEYEHLCDSFVQAGLDAKFIQFCIDAVGYGLTVENLYDLAHAEEDGRLVVLKCKPDNIFYRLLSGGIAVSRFDGFEINEDGEKHWLCGDEYFGESDFGETIFLSCSEAKAAMEMKG